MVGVLSTNFAHHGWPTTKNFKTTLAKTPKNSPQKTKSELEKKSFKTSYLELIFQFQIFSRKSPEQEKLEKNIIHFTIPSRSKKLAYFRDLNSLNIVKNILPQLNQKPTHFTTFPANICTAPFVDAQELHSRNTGKANICISPSEAFIW